MSTTNQNPIKSRKYADNPQNHTPQPIRQMNPEKIIIIILNPQASKGFKNSLEEYKFM